MNLTEETYQLINDYLLGNLSKEQEQVVNERIESDSDFAQELNQQKMLNSLVFSNKMSSLKARMTQDIRSSKKKNKSKRLLLLLLGLILFTAVVISLVPKNGVQKEETTHNNYSKDSSIAIETKPNESIVENAIQTQKESKANNKSTSDNTIITESTQVIDSTDLKMGEIPKDSTTTIVTKVDSSKKERLSLKPDCSVIDIFVKAIASPSCDNENTGVITFMQSSIKGGTAPYSYSIMMASNNTGRNYEFQTEKVFDKLSAGEYYITIKDANSCTTQQKEVVSVSSKKCSKTTGLLFSPENDYVLKFTIRTATSGTISIYNMAKTEVVKLNFGSQGTPEWMGTDSQGSRVPNGLYLYNIDYDNGTVESGQITVY